MLGLNYLTKQSYLFLVLFLLSAFSLNAFTQEVVVNVQNEDITITADQLEQVAKDVEVEAEKEGKDSKTKKALKKVSNSFKKFAKKLKKEKSEDGEKKTKKKLTLNRILYGAGKGATFISTQTLRPFVNMAGFFTGFFEKPGKNQDAKAFLQFFINHEDELDNAWKNTGTIENFAVVLQEKVEKILIDKQVIIIKDLVRHYTKLEVSTETVLKTLGISPYASMDNVQNLQEVLFAELGPELMFFELDSKLINEHPEYQELRPLIGDIKDGELESLMSISPDFDLMDLGNRSRIQLHEGLIAFSAKIFIPKMVLSVVSKSLASVVTVAGLVADAGMIASTLMCTVNDKVKLKLENGDEDLVNFCSYVVNKSAYQISKSRAKGFIAGKNLRRKFIKASGKVESKIDSVGKKEEAEETKLD